MRKYGIAALLALLCMPQVHSDVISEARDLLDSGKSQEALDLLLDELEVDPDNPSAGNLNVLIGEALIRQGDFNEAKGYLEVGKSRGVADASLWLGKLALRNYDLSAASSLYDNYIRMKTNARKKYDRKAEAQRNAIPKVKEALKRVERVQIIDSIDVPAEDFFTHFRLSRSAGRLLTPEETPFPELVSEADVVFMTENGESAFWNMTDSLGRKAIVESIRLTDGSWHDPVFTPEILNGGGNASFPFMMPDGLTLYFANDGEDSLGGYDIFVASRDASDGSWLSPQNMGMPYNSPFDDYMMAIDEATGIGWWATDRNLNPGHLTIFVFVPNERRINIDPEDTDPLPFARISDISATWEPETDIEALKEMIASIDAGSDADREQFRFRFPDGTLATRFDQLSSEEQVSAMRKYLEAEESYNDSRDRLEALRKDYHFNGSTAALKLQISDLEALVLKNKKNLRRLKNELIRTNN